jgi:spore germination protein GerM
MFYVGEDGMALVPAQREVPFGASVAEQARAIIEAQLAPAAPHVSAIPPGVKLRDVFVTERGDAFIDLSTEITANHAGGSLGEIFTVYSLVNALTVNLPAITRVQILVDGKEVDTLAGHVDLRHPLAKSLEWVVHDTQ